MPGIHWLAWQVRFLENLLSQGFSPSEMKIGARTPVAIHNKASRLGLVGDGISRRPWPKAHEKILRRLIKQGWTPLQIAVSRKLAKYTVSAISTKASRLRLVDPERSRRARKSVRLTPAQQEKLKRFLSVNAPCRRTPEELALLWNEIHYPNITRLQVICYLEQLKIKQPWRVVMSMPYSKAKQRRRSPKLIASQERHWKRYRELLRRRLTKAAQELYQKQGPKITVRVCRDCKSSWPACPPFFIIKEKIIRAGKRRYVGRICPLCRNSRRRQQNKQKKQGAFQSQSSPKQR